jgi:tetratricopeptide (TPR) repeat protein
VALLTLQADLHLRLGDVTEAERIVERAAALADEVGVPDFDDMGVVRTKGELALRSDDPETAVRLAETALHTGTATPRGEARLWNLAAIAHNALGDPRAASFALDHCLRAEEAAGLETFLANTHGNYAEVLLALDDPAGAAAHQLAALEQARSMGDATLVAFSQMIAARFALEEGAPVDAVRMQSAADVILAKQGMSLYAGDAQQRQALLDTARDVLGPAEFERARHEGESTPDDRLADQADTILRRRAAARSATTGG